MGLKNRISPQYLRDGEINVTILDVKNPAHFIIRESPNLDVPSKAQEFLEVEDSMQKYYGAIEPSFFQLPLRDAIVVVNDNKKFYRAQVISILNLSRGHMIKVYLLDYGTECSVARSCLFEIHPDFLAFPFQAIDFKLIDLEPISLVMNPVDLSMDYGLVSEWDPSASNFVKAKFKAMINTFIKVEGTGQNCLFGTLHVTFPGDHTVCINDELVLKEFARRNPGCMSYVTRLDAALSKEESCSPSKSSVPESSHLSSESKCLSTASAEMPTAKPKVCGAQKLRELLRTKRKQQQEDLAKSATLPTNVKEIAEIIDSAKNFTLEDECKNKHEDIISKPREFQEDIKCERFEENKYSEPESIDIQQPSIAVPSSADAEKVENVPGDDKDLKSKQPVAGSNASEPGAAKGRANMDKLRELYRKHRRLTLEKPQQDATQDSASEDAQAPASASGGVKLPSVNFGDEISKTQQEISSPKAKEYSPGKASSGEDLNSLKVDDSKIFDLNISSSTSSCNSRRSSIDEDNATFSPSTSMIEEEFSKVIDFSNKSLWEKQKVPALCLGEGLPKPVLSVNETTISQTLQKTLMKLDFHGPSSIQSVVWPAVLRHRCLAAISPPHSGKTVAYLLPIVSNFMSENVYSELPEAKGPVVIIMCSSWRKVQAVYDLFQAFLKGFRLKILTYFADGKSKRSKVIALMNGCDILISVPSLLLNFFKEELICMKRCCHFILDDGTNMLADHLKEVKEIMPLFGEAIKARPKLEIPLQVLINSERWTRGVASFVDKFLHRPLLFFTSFLEAAIYAHVPIFAHVCDESDKNSKVLELINTCGKKTVVSTSDLNKALDIHWFLKSENVRSFLIHEEMEHYISEGVIRDWKCVNSALPYCLVATDSALTCITISEANYIIHYDVPEISRLQFGNRFGCIAENFTKSVISDCGSHILLSETCSAQAVPLLKIIKRAGVEISKELLDFVNQRNKVIDYPDAPLCHYLKAFGVCKLPNCQMRHHVNSSTDKPSIIPNEGDVHAIVTHVFDATHFYVRILRYLPPDSEQTLSLSCEFANLGFKLKKFYNDETNRKIVDCPVVGKNYIIQDGSKLFHRVKVLDVKNLSETECQKITLLYRDEGFIRSVDEFELYEYLDADNLPSPHAVEVYLCGLSTPDSCLDWNPLANHFVRDLVANKEVHGKIALCLGETLWLHPFVLREKLLFINDYINVLTIDRALINAGYAKENKGHLQMLIKACQNKVLLPKLIKKKANLQVQSSIDLKSQISYAFLELNVCEDVYVSSIVSPHQVYVQRVKFVDCLEKLLNEINAKVEAKKLTICSTLLKGMHCIAPFNEDNRYYRALVTNVSSESDDVQLFFPDFGDSCCSPKGSIFTLPPELMLLPFQAIECELDGISAPHGGWSDKAVEFLQDLTRDEDNDMRILEIQAYTKLVSYDSGNRYKVDLWFGEKSLSEHLLEEGLVDPGEKSVPVKVPTAMDEEKEFFDDIPEGYAISSEDDLDPESRYHHGLFCIALSKMMLQGVPQSQAISEALNEIPKNLDRKEFKENSKDTSSISEKDPEAEVELIKSPVLALQRLLNYKKKQEEAKRVKPFIMWWDTLEKLHIMVKLRDIQIYELDIQDSGFTFKSTLKDTDYYIEEQFYADIDSQSSEVKSGILGLSIVLKKQKNEKWPRLVKLERKQPNIKYDLDHIDVSDSEDVSQDCVELSTDENSQGIVTDKTEITGYASDENENSSDDEHFVTPWKKFAEFKDPYNPME